jgi:hypothetical protein
MSTHGQTLDFSHLSIGGEEFFPYCCGNGYFLLWNTTMMGDPEVDVPLEEDSLVLLLEQERPPLKKEI